MRFSAGLRTQNLASSIRNFICVLFPSGRCRSWQCWVHNFHKSEDSFSHGFNLRLKPYIRTGNTLFKEVNSMDTISLALPILGSKDILRMRYINHSDRLNETSLHSFTILISAALNLTKF